MSHRQAADASGSPDGAPPRVSVVIPAHNAAPMLPRLFEALRRQTARPDLWEVLVVDDGSKDDTRHIVDSSGLVRLVVSPRRGPAAARNAGVAQARGELVSFLDADCVPTDDWIERGLAALEATGADMLAGHIGMDLGARPSAVDLVAVSHDLDQERYVSEGFGASGHLWVRGEVLDALGGFDEKLLRDEDRDFVLRATAQGATLKYARSVEVVHPTRSLRDLARRSYRTGLARATGEGGRLRARLRSGPYAGRRYIRNRLAKLGYAPTRRQWAMIYLIKNSCIRGPLMLGILIGRLGRWRARSSES